MRPSFALLDQGSAVRVINDLSSGRVPTLPLALGSTRYASRPVPIPACSPLPPWPCSSMGFSISRPVTAPFLALSRRRLDAPPRNPRPAVTGAAFGDCGSPTPALDSSVGAHAPMCLPRPRDGNVYPRTARSGARHLAADREPCCLTHRSTSASAAARSARVSPSPSSARLRSSSSTRAVSAPFSPSSRASSSTSRPHSARRHHAPPNHETLAQNRAHVPW